MGDTYLNVSTGRYLCITSNPNMYCYTPLCIADHDPIILCDAIKEAVPSYGNTIVRSDPRLWERVKSEIKNGNKGGKPGQWSARKAQLSVSEYKKRGGYYLDKKGNSSTQKPINNALIKWTKEEWNYIDGDKSGRYLPKKVRQNLSPKEKRTENKLKKGATSRGKQYSKYSPSVLAKYRKYTQF